MPEHTVFCYQGGDRRFGMFVKQCVMADTKSYYDV